MIVDIHRHIWAGLEKHHRLREIARRDPVQKARLDLRGELPLVPDWEERGRDIVAEMDGAGVDVSALLLADYALRVGDGIYSMEGENRIQVEMARRYPGRLLPFFGADPRRPGAADLLQKALREWGVKGLKMHPTVGYFPHDRACYPLYDLCVQYDVPVLFHSGPMRGPLFSRYSQPVHFDEVAADFPGLTIILAHSGQDLWPEALNVARMKPNIYLELSYWQYTVKYAREFLFAIDRMRDTIGIERLLWGSDFPGPRHVMSLKEWGGVFQRLPSLGEEYGFSFDDGDVQALLGGNAARILKLAESAAPP